VCADSPHVTTVPPMESFGNLFHTSIFHECLIDTGHECMSGSSSCQQWLTLVQTVNHNVLDRNADHSII
jgi:hypothetical protein